MSRSALPSQPVFQPEQIMTYEPRDPGPYWTHPGYGPRIAAEIDAGLRQHMVRVYGYMAAGSGFRGLSPTSRLSTDRRDTAYLDRHAGAAGNGTIAQLWGLPDERRAQHFSRFRYCALMGLSLAGIFLVFHRSQHSTRLLHQRGDFRGDESIWLYHGTRSLAVCCIPFHGTDWRHNSRPRQYFCRPSALQFAISVNGVIVF